MKFQTIPVIALTATLVALAASAPATLRWTHRAVARHERHLGESLRSRHGLVFLLNLDRAHPTDIAWTAPVEVQDAPRVSTPCRGRRISSRGDSIILPSSVGLGEAPQSATYAMEIAPDDIRRKQTLLNAMSAESGISLTLEEGNLRLLARIGAKEISAVAPYGGVPDSASHIAVTVARDVVVLYQDGRECAKVALPSPVVLLSTGWLFSNASRHPFMGVVSSLAIWNHSLSAREIRRLAVSRLPLAFKLEPGRCFSASAMRFCDSFLRTAFRVIDRIVPLRAGTATLHASVPILTLRMPKSEERHFSKAHEKSLFNGYRTQSAAKAREVDVIFGDAGHRATVWLEDQYSTSAQSRRPAFVVACDGLAPFGAAGVARLYPPELHAVFHPDASCSIPLNGTLVRLYEDASFRGVYVVEPLDAPGSAWMERGAPSPEALYFGGRSKPVDILPDGVDREEALHRITRLFLSDPLFPWSAAEAKAREDAISMDTNMSSAAAHDHKNQRHAALLGPGQSGLPVVSIHVSSPVEKVRRHDFSFTVTTADGTMVSARGLTGFGGGIRHRGNTSYARGIKRSLSLKFDTPLPWPDPGRPTSHLILHSGYADPTRLRNKLSFEFYHDAAAACGHPDLPAPSFSHVELWFNGEYFGVWETSNRVRDLIPADWALYKVRGVNRSLWATTDTSMLDCLTSPPGESGAYDTIRDLFALTSSDSDTDLSAALESRLDLDNIVCFWLLLNFSANYDGRTMNQYLAVNPANGRVTVIPWDYDKTFFRCSHILTNHLLSRLYDKDRDFTSRLRDIWQKLRAGPWSDAAVRARIEADAAMLSSCMAGEWRLLQPAGFNGNFDDAIRFLQNAIQTQLNFLDGVLGNVHIEERTSDASQS